MSMITRRNRMIVGLKMNPKMLAVRIRMHDTNDGTSTHDASDGTST